MYYLIYVSYATSKPDSEVLKGIAEVSHLNNIKRDVSGMLIYLDGKFLQILEGEKDTVLTLYNKILRDPRHEKVRILIEGDLQKRNFKNWAMGFKMLNKHDFQSMSGLTDLDDFFKSKEVGEDSHVALIFLRLFYQKNNRDFAFDQP